MEIIDNLSSLLETAKTNLKTAEINSVTYNNETILINNVGFKHIATAINNIQLDKKVNIETGIYTVPEEEVGAPGLQNRIKSLSYTFTQLNKIYYVIILCPFDTESQSNNSVAEGFWGYFDFLSNTPTVLARRWIGVKTTRYKISGSTVGVSTSPSISEKDSDMIQNFSINNKTFSATFKHYIRSTSDGFGAAATNPFNILIIGLGE